MFAASAIHLFIADDAGCAYVMAVECVSVRICARNAEQLVLTFWLVLNSSSSSLFLSIPHSCLLHHFSRRPFCGCISSSRCRHYSTRSPRRPRHKCNGNGVILVLCSLWRRRQRSALLSWPGLPSSSRGIHALVQDVCDDVYLTSSLWCSFFLLSAVMVFIVCGHT